MFSKELQQLIEASLVDGVLTDQERAVIRKRALLDGVDPDEVDLILDAELQRIHQRQEETVAKVKKCPHCGEILPALTGVCPSCGYVINAQSQDNKDLLDLISEMEEELEDLKSGFTDNPDEQIAAIDTYRRKAKMLYGDNKKVQFLLAEIEVELERYKEKQAKKRKFLYFKIIAAIIVVIIFIIGCMYSCNQKEAKRQAEIEQLMKQANEQCDSLCRLLSEFEIPNKSNYKEIETGLLGITWKEINIPDEYHDTYWSILPIKDAYLEKKRSIASQVYAVYKEIYGEEASDKSPDFIRKTILY